MSSRKALHFWNQCGTLEILDDDNENEEMCELETSKISKVLDRISEVMKIGWKVKVIVITSTFYICKTLRHVMKKHHQL
jgi:hypothetical protein